MACDPVGTNFTDWILPVLLLTITITTRGRSDASLEGLRQRLSNLFLEFARNPNFNREAVRFLRVHTDQVEPLFPVRIGAPFK